MRRLALTALAGFLATPALAHVTLEVPHAAPDTGYKAVFRVPHGCDGAATTALRIQIPEGFIEAKPMPKPGWTLNIKTGDYAKAYKLFGADVTSGVTEVDFTGGNLPDAAYDEFVVAGHVAGSFLPGDVIFFPVVQECGAAADRWIEIPKEGHASGELKRPAPHLDVIAPSQ
jgi:periplasmic copper chaperone A